VLRCQNADVVDASAEQLAELLNIIVETLQRMKEFDIAFSEEFRQFVNAWGEKVQGIGILEEHFKIITEGNLI
jgi:hypothetical protein